MYRQRRIVFTPSCPRAARAHYREDQPSRPSSSSWCSLPRPPAARQVRAFIKFGGKRVVSPRATNSSSQQPPALEEVLEAGNIIGTAAFEVLTEEAVEVAAEASRLQAEQLRILSRLPEDPQGTLNDLVQDIQSRGVPSVSDVMNRATNVMGDIQTRVDEQLSTSQTGRQAEDTVDENAPPEMPDPKDLADDVMAEAAAARESVKKASENNKI